MNEYDLADRLEEFYTGTHIQKAAETIRQQAEKIKNMEIWEKKYLDRIEELEGRLK